MLGCIMSNSKTNVKSMTSNIPSNKTIITNHNQLLAKRLTSINTQSPKPSNGETAKHQSCEILADQNSNSNSDESSETSSADSSGDQRMDAAESLLSIANTPTTEFKAFVPSNNTNSVSPILPPKQIGNNLEIVIKHFFVLTARFENYATSLDIFLNNMNQIDKTNI